MEKDIGKIPKSMDTEIIVRIDDFGGRVGLTIREFVRSERYSGFTKAGTRIPADQFHLFKELINAIDEKELMKLAASTVVQASVPSSAPAAPSAPSTYAAPSTTSAPKSAKPVEKKPSKAKAIVEEIPDQEF